MAGQVPLFLTSFTDPFFSFLSSVNNKIVVRGLSFELNPDSFSWPFLCFTTSPIVVIVRMTLVKRKRPRDSETDSDSLPISKKFNGLNITSEETDRLSADVTKSFQITNDCQKLEQLKRNQAKSRLTEGQQEVEGRSPGREASDSTNGSQDQSSQSYPSLPQYQPSRASHENPVYYEMNRVLFEAHVSRLNRSSGSTPLVPSIPSHHYSRSGHG